MAVTILVPYVRNIDDDDLVLYSIVEHRKFNCFLPGYWRIPSVLLRRRASLVSSFVAVGIFPTRPES